ncbi:MAG: hypothetical protein A3A98_01490 [Candidatus Staskawiczbacteria bacterium RIFCSPLOWO2_01_FULL_40_39]|uniref:Uncharacterized protein n=1 Tax=Candidatus Staskawiczbacteria bacterium RIFCSPHIGHO2_01_FULL_39_25 TaxID=1802202 RepID=A0A1G2HQC9_9BACT|nr:MAG: hypothetical protein A2730_01645 [Candidatus Staskawiczbacteria bacterium RIFCSPHIGHO2_01_FULL_39_25]OGZ72651.1 MAG: hypothetical protein A3A98_01490 [Candidatus Staskawiczbacteria bacterium RIFCSPLOWO2_01_FULL_40_39]OGZ76694.1 MAG: hypothetical protein A3I87_00135 [Candidatus Staskawiczbacteria bacterium RIFCSPLOWO2_02_FULL_39_8]
MEKIFTFAVMLKVNFAGSLAWSPPLAAQTAENLDSEIALAISTIGTFNIIAKDFRKRPIL